jgi:hypothetical protein
LDQRWGAPQCPQIYLNLWIDPWGSGHGHINIVRQWAGVEDVTPDKLPLKKDKNGDVAEALNLTRFGKKYREFSGRWYDD